MSVQSRDSSSPGSGDPVEREDVDVVDSGCPPRVTTVADDSDDDSTARHPDASSLPTELVLHSPSTLVGTPFATDSPFEYPFPGTTTPPSEPNCPSLPIMGGTSPLHSQILSRSQPVLSLNFTATHSKLRNAGGREPPVPPGLAKRWGAELGLGNNINVGSRVKDGSDDGSSTADSNDSIGSGMAAAIENKVDGDG